MKMLLLMMCLTALAGCQSSADSSARSAPPDFHADRVGSREAVQTLARQFSEFKNLGMEKSEEHPELPQRSRRFAVGEILPHIHSWLSPGRGLERRSVHGEDVWILRSLPQEVVDQISEVTFDNQLPSGFSILQAAFWRMARQKMAQGITIGFFEYDSKDRVNGMYVDDERTILIDLISNDGVLVHESRHYDQFAALRQHAHAHSRSQAVSASCMGAVSRFFGELDATTMELPTWRGVFQSVDTQPDVSLGAPSLDGAFDSTSLQTILDANLGYPDYAMSTWIAAVDVQHPCPSQLMDKLYAIVKSTIDFSSLVSTSVNSLEGIRVNDMRTEIEAATHQCAATNQTAECLRCEDEITGDQKRGQILKAQIDAEFDSAQAERIAVIRENLKGLDRSVSEDLCNGALGFEFYYDCSTFFRGNEK